MCVSVDFFAAQIQNSKPPMITSVVAVVIIIVIPTVHGTARAGAGAATVATIWDIHRNTHRKAHSQHSQPLYNNI